MTINFKNLIFESIESHSISDVSFIKNELVKFNNHCLNLPENSPGPQPVSVMVRNEKGELIGGAYAHAYLSVMHIYGLWVNPDYRNIGVGRRVCKDLETLAEKFNCHTAIMDTHSFQMTSNFYNKLSVLFLNKIKNSPPGHTKFIMINKLQNDKTIFWKFKSFLQNLNAKIEKHM